MLFHIKKPRITRGMRSLSFLYLRLFLLLLIALSNLRKQVIVGRVSDTHIDEVARLNVRISFDKDQTVNIRCICRRTGCGNAVFVCRFVYQYPNRAAYLLS